MKGLGIVLGIVGLVGMFVGVILADDVIKAPPISGTVVKVDGTTLVVNVPVKDAEKPKEMKIATDDKTTVTLDGKDAKLADLKADMTVTITMTTAAPPVAATIVALAAKVPVPAPAT